MLVVPVVLNTHHHSSSSRHRVLRPQTVSSSVVHKSCPHESCCCCSCLNQWSSHHSSHHPLPMKSCPRMSWVTVIHLFLVLLEGYCMEVASSSRLPDIYWNVSNPIFRIDNTDHIIDVNRGNNKFEYDQVNLICPSYPEGTKEEDTESYIIYNVSKEEYESCSITNPNARAIAVCDRPNKLMYFTVTFRSFTPQPGGLEFKPGQDYYFMSTSTGTPEGLHNKVGGKCRSNHLKVTFKVCCGASTTPSTTSTTSSVTSSTANPSVVHSAHGLPSMTPKSQSSHFMRALSSTTSTPSPSRVILPTVGSWSRSWESTSTTRTPSFSSNSTPFWWKPQHPSPPSHFNRPGNGDRMYHNPDFNKNDTQDRGNPRKGRAWILVVAAGIAVAVACLIFCGLGVGRRLFIREKHKETVIRPHPGTLHHHHHHGLLMI